MPHEHPTREDLFDLDWEQVDERYDPRLLSEDLINESQSDSDRKDDSHRRQAEHCYFEARKYEHGQKVKVDLLFVVCGASRLICARYPDRPRRPIWLLVKKVL